MVVVIPGGAVVLVVKLVKVVAMVVDGGSDLCR